MNTEYNLLNKTEDYDLPTVKELASAMNELAEIEDRRRYLEEIIRTNGKLKKHIWRDKSGYAIPLADLEDDHLKNIVNLLRRHNQDVPANITRELGKRKISGADVRISSYLSVPEYLKATAEK